MKDTLNTIQSVLERFFGASEVPRKLEGGLSHEVYSLDKAKLIVKIYSSEVSAEKLETEQKALEILEKSNKISAPKLILSNRGNFREPLNSNFLSCYKKIEGERRFLLTESPKKLNQIADIGRYLGRLHGELSYSAGAFTPKLSPIFEIARSIVSKPDEIDQTVNELINNQAPYFITHGDFQQSNLLYLGETISGIIDFEYSTPDFRITDVAGCLSNLLSANSSYLDKSKLIETFINSYEEVCSSPLILAEKNLLERVIEIIWRVNLFWADSKLKTVQSAGNQALLKLYKTQTESCLSN